MTTRKRKAVELGLVQKGFVLNTESGGDHRYYVFLLKGRCVARTKVSHGSKYKDLSDDLLTLMSRQCRLPKMDFLKLVDCTMSQKDYEQFLHDHRLDK